MPPGAVGVAQSGARGSISSPFSPHSSQAPSPSAMPLKKAASGPRSDGYHGGAATGAVNGPLRQNDVRAVLYGRMPNDMPTNRWPAPCHLNLRSGPLPSFLNEGCEIVEGMEGLQLSAGGENGMVRAQQRQKVGDGECQEETEDDLFAMFRFKVIPLSRTPVVCSHLI